MTNTSFFCGVIFALSVVFLSVPCTAQAATCEGLRLKCESECRSFPGSERNLFSNHYGCTKHKELALVAGCYAGCKLAEKTCKEFHMSSNGKGRPKTARAQEPKPAKPVNAANGPRCKTKPQGNI